MLIWIVFILFVLLMLALDLGIFHREPKAPSITEALGWTLVWVMLALGFNICVYFMYERHLFGLGLAGGDELTGTEAALQFFTGYVIEKSLSLDNIFIIALIFSYFSVDLKYQHRLLFWGIIGALIMRGIMIALGYALFTTFWWTSSLFGAILIATAVKMLIAHHDNLEPEKNPVVRFVKRFYPVTGSSDGAFFAEIDGKKGVTSLFLALVMIESTDLLFAIDSIPAIFAITSDPFLVYTSNVFAILGLRSLYFALAAMLEKFRYMKTSLVFLLAFVGVKMIMIPHYHMPTHISLSLIAGILSVGILASLVGKKGGDTAQLVSPLAEEMTNLAITTYKAARRLAVGIIGSTVVLVGIIMIFLPGPAIVVIPAGLTILAGEFVWAKRLLRKTKLTMNRQLNNFKNNK
ncbi:MAG: TerC/Alx family metal homeostasis membrane protein [Nitrospinota bacterium]|nr:TerC/Alx family metal homeostasis membrane protein [Nitrospinota bacterium]